MYSEFFLKLAPLKNLSLKKSIEYYKIHSKFLIVKVHVNRKLMFTH